MQTSGPLCTGDMVAARRLLHEAECAYLGVVEPQGPYVVPLNFAYVETDEPGDGAGALGQGLSGRLYFHSGEGRKSKALAADPRVCLAVTAEVRFQRGDAPCADGFSYRSVILWGRARRLKTTGERRQALRAIVAKYDRAAADALFGEAEFTRALLYEVTIEAASYKAEP